MTAPNTAPTGEIGRPGNLRPTYNFDRTGPSGQVFESNPSEYNPELRFPSSIRVYSQMRTDDQVQGLIRACTLPIMEAGWDLDATGCSPKVEQLVRAELGIPADGEPLLARRRGQSGIVWQEHLREALTCLTYGFAPFEQVYTITQPGEAGHLPGFEDQPIVHLKKLAQRLPGTIRKVEVAQDGGLLGVRQSNASNVWNGQLASGGPMYAGELDVWIPVDRLVFYVVDKEGADWYGTSVLRAAYRPWFEKDQLGRIQLQAAERNSMGIPAVTYDPSSDVSKEDALEIASNVRAGATGGVALPLGAKLELLGVTGSTVDIAPIIDTKNQAITKAGLAMFMDLGHDRGAYNLGALFVDMFDRQLKAIAQSIATTATEHVVRDLVEWNFGPDEPYPKIIPGKISAQSALSPADLALLATAGLITPDDTLEDSFRDDWSMPPIDKAGRKPAPIVQPQTDPFTHPGNSSGLETPPKVPAVPDVPKTGSLSEADDDAVSYGARLMQRMKTLAGKPRART